MSASVTVDGMNFGAEFAGSTLSLMSLLQSFMREPHPTKELTPFLESVFLSYRARSRQQSDAWKNFFAFCERQPASAVSDYRELIEGQFDGDR